MGKVILDTCQKTTFSLNNKMYEQIDGVSMGGSLGPALANIIMTEFEKVVVENLIKTGIVKLYARYVDDTLLVIKRKDIDFILQKFNSFDKSLKFTIDTFEHFVSHFLDIEICPNGLGVYHKNTETGQYINTNSFTLWKWKTSWITSLVVRVKRICCNDDLNKEIRLIKNFASWDGFPKNITNSVIKKALKDMPNVNNTPSVSTYSIKIFFDLQYSGDTVERMVKNCIKKLRTSLKRDTNIKFIVCYKTTNMSFYTNTKDKTPLLSQSSYKFTCHGRSSSYVGKKERTLFERTEEHAYTSKKKNDQSAIFEHVSTYSYYDHMWDLFNLNINDVLRRKFDVNQIGDNTIVLHRCNNWNELLFKEH